MCTSLNFKVEDGTVMLARTMDFSIVVASEIMMIPRAMQWSSSVDTSSVSMQYGFIGMGKAVNGEYIFADGVNEKGLSCASLYFQDYATYSDGTVDGKQNLAPHEVVMYLLATCATIAEVREAFAHVNIVTKAVDFLGVITPLHWVVTDETGDSVVIEPVADGIKIYDHVAGVMANSPDYGWHLTNLRNYAGLSQRPAAPLEVNGLTLESFGGAGSSAVPGGFTTTARFVRTFFAKAALKEIKSVEDGVTAVFHVLEGVTIPKGNVITPINANDFTQYTACMVNTERKYYFKTYENSQITVVDLLSEDLDATEPKVWNVARKQAYAQLNGE